MQRASDQRKYSGIGRFAAPAAITTLLSVALLFRMIDLGHLPGLNGDEAWYGVLARKLLAGGDPLWRTPTGNLPGPFQLGLLLILEPLFGPGFALLRVPSLLSSIAAVLLVGWIMRRHFGTTTGLIALLLMATLPVLIAYARFGWDPSHVPLVGLVAIGLALARRRIACAFAFAVALAAHPTNVFLAPFLLPTLLGAEREAGGWRPALMRTSLAGGLLLLALGVLAVTTSGGMTTTHPSEILARLIDPTQWAAFLLLYGRLLSGDTVYTYIAGAGFGAEQRIVDMAAMLTILGLAGAGLWSLRRRPFGREAGIVTGWLASLIAFALIAGPGAMSPHFERYAICLIAPSVIAFAVLAREMGGRGERMGRLLAVTMLIAALLLAGFARHYLHALASTGSLSHRAFHSGPVEPKQAAFAAIEAERRMRPVPVLAEDWWLAWPIAYLADGLFAVTDASTLATVRPAEPAIWAVFAGSALDERLATTPGALLRATISGTGRPSLIHIWRTGTDSPRDPASTGPAPALPRRRSVSAR